jgi:hypothetical protein
MNIEVIGLVGSKAAHLGATTFDAWFSQPKAAH